MLYLDNPARIPAPGTHAFRTDLDAVYTVGREEAVEALKGIFKRTRRLACDIETYGLGLDALRIKSVSFSDHRHAVVFDPRDPAQEWAIRMAMSHARELFFHNSPYDVPSLYLNGLMSLDDVAKVTDTLIWSRLADPGERVRKNLAECSARYLGGTSKDVLVDAFKALGLSKKDGFRTFDLDRPIFLQGAASDPLVTIRLADVVRQAALARLTQNHPFSEWGVDGPEAERLVDREQRLNRIFLRRSCIGFLIDFEYLDRYRAENAEEVRAAEAALAEHGIRAGNGQDLAKRLVELGELPPDHPKTDTGLWRMRAKDVERLAHPLARSFLRHKKIEKVGKDYLTKCAELADANGRVHPTVNWLAAATGRASMGDPPLHQFSGPARGIILAEPGDALTSIDWSQIEPVTMANVAGDRKVLEGYELRGEKLYDSIAAIAKISYKAAKVVLLAQMYGEGLAKLSADLDLDPGPYVALPADDWRVRKGMNKAGDIVPEYQAAKELRAAVFRAMPASRELISKLKDIAFNYQLIFTVSGRILTIPRVMGRVETHKGVNYFCQGGAYDVLAEAIIRVDEAGLSEALYLSMHDEMITSTGAAHDIRKIMEVPPERLCKLAGRTPVLRTDMADLGERWAEA